MKKLLSMCLAALAVAASVSVAAYAAAADWTPGNGFHIVDTDGNVVSENSPVTVTDTADGVEVMHGGYYQTGANWGGVASKEAYNLNGLEVTVRLDKFPEVSAADDCWVAVNFLEKGQMFDVKDVPGNRGFMCLVRFGRPYLEIYDGAEGFKQIFNTQSVFDRNEIFSLAQGDVIKFRVDYNGLYQFTYTKNDEEPYVIPYNFTQLSEAFKDGKAHIAMACNLKGSEENEFVYTITNVTDGTPKTAEEIANEEAAIAEALAAAEKAAEEEAARLAAEQEAKRAEKEAEEKAAAEQAAKEALEAAQQAASGEADTTDAAADTADEVVEEENNSNVGLIVAIVIIAVVIIAVIVVVVLKKKKK